MSTLPLGHPYVVKSIEKVVNPRAFLLYKGYVAANRITDELHHHEVYAFHGTSIARSLKICQENFDRSENQTFLGRQYATYFARYASYSVPTFTPDDDENGDRAVLLCRVCVGRPMLFNISRTVHPRQQSCDTVVDDIHNPMIWAAYNDNQAFAEFRIIFK